MQRAAHLFFSPSPPSPIILHNMSSKSAKHASSKENRMQANKFLQKYLASCFCEGLRMEQESALAFTMLQRFLMTKISLRLKICKAS